MMIDADRRLAEMSEATRPGTPALLSISMPSVARTAPMPCQERA